MVTDSSKCCEFTAFGATLAISARLAEIAKVAPDAVNLQHLLLSVTSAVDQQPLRQTAENAVNSQTCYDLARKLRLNRHPSTGGSWLGLFSQLAVCAR